MRVEGKVPLMRRSLLFLRTNGNGHAGGQRESIVSERGWGEDLMLIHCLLKGNGASPGKNVRGMRHLERRDERATKNPMFFGKNMVRQGMKPVKMEKKLIITR